MNEKARKTITYQRETRLRSYLLRLWQADTHDGSSWQASLVTLENGKRLGFTSLEELFTYLMDQTNYQTFTGEN